ncbi:MAG: tRNA uridine-5-carboxymethylaminomethyl(34) synthesis GTPase MnmE [Gammaproteobacteria bacterium]|nr:tRNA uridine-5-carboxymethylaminomethyl(34) synthesis GTPase MnmE [Gammaproteobacteria bacterium]
MAADTIAALATPPGRGGVGIIRVSGPLSPAIALKIVKKSLPPRQAQYLPFYQMDGTMLDMGIALYFPAPHSFTGEHILELHGHGGPVVMDMLLNTVVDLGARLARPGEFSQRAFLNDKLDLAQAEAIADLIDSASEQAARLALRSLQGVFSERVRDTLDALIQLRMYVEAAIDFPEEEIDFLHDRQISEQLNKVLVSVQTTLASATQGCLMREGMNVVIAGKPNAGKSTLLNQLTGRDTAIVTEIPGTTRDVLREQIHIDGLPVHIIDTAGLRHSADQVEQEGIRRAWKEIEQADRILYLIDHQQSLSEEDRQFLEKLRHAGPGLTIVHNKIDLSGTSPRCEQSAAQDEIYLSAKQGAGIELLREYLKACVGFQQAGEGAFMARRRHVQALQQALNHIETARQQLSAGAGELLAEDLRQAQQHLSEITGQFTSDDLLGRIFSSFCIGK